MLEQTHALARLTQQDVVLARDAAKSLAMMQRPLRTERTIRTLAKEMADLCWDNPALLFEWNLQHVGEQTLFNGVGMRLAEKDWPDGWRMTYRVLWPDVKVHRMLMWPRFYRAARERLISMLDHRSGVNEHMKARIYDAVLEDWNEKGN
jgi:hypothetical protein